MEAWGGRAARLGVSVGRPSRGTALPRLERVLERSMMVCLLGLFRTERLAREMSAVTRVMEILQDGEGMSGWGSHSGCNAPTPVHTHPLGGQDRTLLLPPSSLAPHGWGYLELEPQDPCSSGERAPPPTARTMGQG